MELSHETVRAIAELAKLELTDEEVERYAGQLSHILGYFEHLQEVDTSDVEAITSVLPLKNIMRQDIPQPPLTPDEAVANAPDSDDHQFRVRAVLDE
ncbi:MAG: Asp-tRNA(Asn)/Glu-tRNA(Gln) amidotransferase subunit GatC [Phototrophicales bacterium]|nr:MAG: Asp-tRNA(Asn)/Glu-tRNA(Gln) amidotransferase GatCAB subunit C [Phototrophicales bacterium]RMG77274.1 MAG: Asp-tRNA(Asn)/Glu-tRNA(Gln) amidotransferase subunit GatC [Chloroflexota bacterium]